MIKVLLVDDEAMIRALVRSAITAAVPGAAVVEADCGEGALRLARSQAPFQLVVTDIVMPGIDGLDMAGKLATDGYARKFLFISAYADPSRVQARLATFASARFVPKPFDFPRLIETIRSMAQEATAPAQTACVRGRHSRSELRMRCMPALPLEREVRRFAALRAKNAATDASLRSAFEFQQLWLQQIQQNLIDIKAISRRLPPGSGFRRKPTVPPPDSVTITA